MMYVQKPGKEFFHKKNKAVGADRSISGNQKDISTLMSEKLHSSYAAHRAKDFVCPAQKSVEKLQRQARQSV